MSARTRAKSGSSGEAPPAPDAAFAVLSIGALSRATGVPVETLRTWERRYGFPEPAPRGDSGHRRYPLAAVARLRLVVRALEAGHAPSAVLRAGAATLRELVAVGTSHSSSDGPATRAASPSAEDGSFEDRCTRLVLELDGEGLTGELERAWDEVGGLECLRTRIGPFLRALGTGWSAGVIEVGHEHFASEHVREFLSHHWRPMSERNTHPRVVCATVAGELHVLGLHMAATALALAGARVVFLGANTPPEDVARTTKSQRAGAVALSAAAGTSARLLNRDVATLRNSLPANIPIVVGGEGFETPPSEVVSQGDLRELFDWGRQLAKSPPGGRPTRKSRR